MFSYNLKENDCITRQTEKEFSGLVIYLSVLKGIRNETVHVLTYTEILHCLFFWA